ncbi:pilus assembly protein [Microvirga sp. 0TCS3.31]
MSAEKSLRINRWMIVPPSVLVLAALGGCVDYLERRDTITLSAGEAQDWNKVVHVADPWPAHAKNTHIPGDGQRTARVIGRYSVGSEPANGSPGSADAPASAQDAADAPRPQQ